MKNVGKRAIGRRKDTSYRDGFKRSFPRGWKTEGEITQYDRVSQKYLIKGTNYIFNEAGTFKVNGDGDWFYRWQIQILDEDA